jgi:hypothetical protein
LDIKFYQAEIVHSVDVPESFDKQEWKNKQDTPCRQMYKDGIPFFT